MPFIVKLPAFYRIVLSSPATSLSGLLIVMLSAVLVAGPASAATGEIFKWTDAEGNVHYGSKRPDDASVEKMNVNTSKTGVNRGAAALDKLKQEADDEAQKIKEEGIAAKPPVPSLPKQEVRRRCQAAKQDLATIRSRGQIRERDHKGNTRYLSDKEKQRRIKQAQSQISEYCK